MEKGIIFNAEMVRAILDGRKTMTRRLNKQWLKVKAGDRLWVRETWKPHVQTSVHSPAIYRADYPLGSGPGPWISSRFMPRWASRITLEATADARLEKLQKITGMDVGREGFEWDAMGDDPFYRFAKYWDSLNPKSPWKNNPEVVVIEFKNGS